MVFVKPDGKNVTFSGHGRQGEYLVDMALFFPLTR